MAELKPDLYEAILQLKTIDECQAFFKDLCTPKEIKDMHDRWLVAQMLNQGNLSYRQISQETGISLTTITRVARFLTQEPYNGYRTILDRIHTKHHHHHSHH